VQKAAGLDENRVGDILSRIEERLTATEIKIPRWTAAEFERLVFAGNPRVAVFDCDGTLWGGDSGSGFLAWSIEQGLVSRSTSEWLDRRYAEYRAGRVSEETICGEVVQIYAGLREQELRSAAAEYVREFVRDKHFSEMVSLVEALRSAGVELWAVSSTNKWVISEAVRDFEISEERVLAVEMRIDRGVISSEIVDVPSGEGKANALRRVGLAAPDAVFGNSIHDLAMLKMARCPFPVNPSPALLEAAARNGWGYFLPQAAGGLSAAVGGE
jgi:phosphoserine phosphatase